MSQDPTSSDLVAAISLDHENLGIAWTDVKDDIGTVAIESKVAERGSLTPDAARLAVAAYLGPKSHQLKAIGISSFGPIDLSRDETRLGRIFNLSAGHRQSWQHVNVIDCVREALPNLPGTKFTVAIDSAAAAHCEYYWGRNNGQESLVYIIVTGGIGGSQISPSGEWKGESHSEMGHIPVSKLPYDTFPGVCRFHGDCLDGLVSAPAILQRTGAASLAALTAKPEHEVWYIVADYLAQLCKSIAFMMAPTTIVLGGEVMHPGLYPKIKGRFNKWLKLGRGGQARQIEYDAMSHPDFIRPPRFDPAPLLGALMLAQRTYRGTELIAFGDARREMTR